jgi:putative Mg2+ transporter-C (MgtC) family protein
MQSLQWTYAFHIFCALILGTIVGIERQWHHCMAGTRTNAIVSAGAAAFVMSGILADHDTSAAARIAAAVVTGIGFLGAGVIFKDQSSIHGLTTAATVWCSAAIGILAGEGFLFMATVVTFLVLASNIALRPLATLLNKQQLLMEQEMLKVKARAVALEFADIPGAIMPGSEEEYAELEEDASENQEAQTEKRAA